MRVSNISDIKCLLLFKCYYSTLNTKFNTFTSSTESLFSIFWLHRCSVRTLSTYQRQLKYLVIVNLHILSTHIYESYKFLFFLATFFSHLCAVFHIFASLVADFFPSNFVKCWIITLKKWYLTFYHLIIIAHTIALIEIRNHFSRAQSNYF